MPSSGTRRVSSSRATSLPPSSAAFSPSSPIPLLLHSRLYPKQSASKKTKATAFSIFSDEEIDIDPETAARRQEFQDAFIQTYPTDSQLDTQPLRTSQPSQSSANFPFTLNSQQTDSTLSRPRTVKKLQASFWIDGGCADRSGASAFLCYHGNHCHFQADKIQGTTTNNVAEFNALLKILRFAMEKKYTRIMITADSMLVVKFLRGTVTSFRENLLPIVTLIRPLLAEFEAIYVSHIHAHRDLFLENGVADALCSWAIKFDSSFEYSACMDKGTPHNCTVPTLAYKLKLKSKSRSPIACVYCHSTHTGACPLKRFMLSSFAAKDTCQCCLSPLHATDCPLQSSAQYKPVRSHFTPEQLPSASEADADRVAAFIAQDLDALHFPNNCSRKQFLDYYFTVVLSLDLAASTTEVKAAVTAAGLWRKNYYFVGDCIRRSKARTDKNVRTTGTNLYSPLENPSITTAKRVIRVANMLPNARVSDVSKALRTGAPTPLSADIKSKLQECYPQASPDEDFPFEQCPLANFVCNRDVLARIIMSRSPRSHPGFAGISFDILQHYCRWTYKKEDPECPDYRWDVLCRLISKIMSGNASHLSEFLLDVMGAFFNKNAENVDAPFALRNLGIEESLMRISAALVFDEVIPDAVKKGKLDIFDLGVGTKSGAEIFGRLGALFARSGSPTAVFDIVKAFNHLRRKDIFAAMVDLDNPLFSAFMSFLFSRISKVTFKCPLTGETFIAWLTKGIHQGNPLSVFIFCLTIAYILRDFRAQHPEVIVASFVDDFLFTIRNGDIDAFPATLEKLLRLFRSHGLRFDLSDSAKSSVYSKAPLPLHVATGIQRLEMRCQNDGIKPCKIPYGSTSFCQSFADKALIKLQGRFALFKDLFPALIKLDRERKRPSHRNFEHFLNLIRLSFLSMPIYVLRTLPPSFCVAYRQASSQMALQLIQNVLPPFVELPPSPVPNLEEYPDFTLLSRRIMQLPLSMGGLSLRIPESIGDIAYAASATDSLPVLTLAAVRLRFPFSYNLIPELVDTRRRIQAEVPAVDSNFWMKIEDPQDLDYKDEPLQHTITSLKNKAEIASIATLLKPWPMHFHAFSARVDKGQEHVSWPFNPKSRSALGLGMLTDDEFSRAISLAIFHPVVAPRTCACGQPIDPAALHLLRCHFNHYGNLHDRVKYAVASRLRSFMQDEVAAFSVLTEQPMRSHFALRNPDRPGGVERFADLIVSMHSELQQEPLACDFVSCMSHGNASYQDCFTEKSRLKRKIYSTYTVPANALFPLPFGRTNVLSQDVFDFCSLIGRYLPKHVRADEKLRASFSRAIYVGVSQTFNLSLRRLQLSATQDRLISSFPLASLSAPYVAVPRTRPVANFRRPVLTKASLFDRLAAALASQSLDARVALTPSGALRRVSSVSEAVGGDMVVFESGGG